MQTRPSDASKYTMRPSNAARNAGWSRIKCEPFVPMTREPAPSSTPADRSSHAPVALTTVSAVTSTVSPVISSRRLRVLPRHAVTLQ
ncbi:hypothetical protein G6F50_016260 [Rhizopus delemar]|uniref:Uncharacterized protein n=1 Tax=Rhizopus delemar TaxID=936053 RepID=A0A9P6XUB8_9FUNG|nr:hypothetical protein G6F50_016260 [Rhizopus delemar]